MFDAHESQIETSKALIAKFGGPAKVAEICDRTVSRVRRWTYPAERGGSDGIIPADCQLTLLAHARATDLPVTPADFFPPELVDGEDAA